MKQSKLTSYVIILSCFIMLFVTVFEITKTYGLFESKTTNTVTNNIATWNIFINDTSIKEETILIDNVTVDSSTNTAPGKIAPGGKAYFDLVFNPKDTKVAIRYDMTLDFTLSKRVTFSSISEINGKNLIRTGNNTYTGIITLDNINNKENHVVRIYVDWLNDEALNNEDSEIGKTLNNIIKIPVNIVTQQYLGEEVLEFKENDKVVM